MLEALRIPILFVRRTTTATRCLRAWFGTVHRVYVDELSLEDLAVYYFNRVQQKYDLEVTETFDPKDKTTVLEIRMTEPQDITDFCAFEVFAPIATLFAAGTTNRPRSYGMEFTYQF